MTALSLTSDVLVIFQDNFLGLLAGEEEELGCVAEVMILGGEVFHQSRAFVRRRQSIRERAIQSFLSHVLVPVETMAGGEDIIVELHHRQHRRVQNVLGCLHVGRRVLEHPVMEGNRISASYFKNDEIQFSLPLFFDSLLAHLLFHSTFQVPLVCAFTYCETRAAPRLKIKI